jgi:signal peptidase II
MLFWTLVTAWVAIDVVTKAWAESKLVPRLPNEVLGDVLRFTLIYNQGAAFGMHIGEWSRWVFGILTLGALGLLAHLFRETRPGDTPRIIALALVTAGAIGNLVDRIQSARGVIDFIDVGIGSRRFWTFNVADVGVSCGAILLAIVLWQEERVRHALEKTHAAQSPDPAPPVLPH